MCITKKCVAPATFCDLTVEMEMRGLYQALLLNFVNTLCGILGNTLSFLVELVLWLCCGCLW
jgi:hypothetical protein